MALYVILNVTDMFLYIALCFYIGNTNDCLSSRQCLSQDPDATRQPTDLRSQAPHTSSHRGRAQTDLAMFVHCYLLPRQIKISMHLTEKSCGTGNASWVPNPYSGLSRWLSHCCRVWLSFSLKQGPIIHTEEKIIVTMRVHTIYLLIYLHNGD